MSRFLYFSEITGVPYLLNAIGVCPFKVNLF